VRPCLDLPRFRDWVSSTLGTACRSRGGSEDFTARRRLPRTREGESSRCKHFGQRRAWGVRRRRRLIGSRIRSWQLVVKTPKPSSWRHECLLWCGSPQRGRRPGKQPTLRSCGSQRADGRLEEERSASSQATRRKPPSSTRRFLAGDSLPHPARVEEQLEGSRSDLGIHAGRSSPTAREPGNLCHFLNLSPPGAVTDRAWENSRNVSSERVYNSLEEVANEGLVKLCAGRLSRSLSGSTRERIAKSIGGVKE